MMLSLFFSAVSCLSTRYYSEETSVYRNGFGYSCESTVPNCLPNSCIFDLAGGLFCVECGSTYVPINGTCVSVSDGTVNEAGCVK